MSSLDSRISIRVLSYFWY